MSGNLFPFKLDRPCSHGLGVKNTVGKPSDMFKEPAFFFNRL